MQVKVSNPSQVEAVITVISGAEELAIIKGQVLERFQRQIKVPGFRAGKIPATVLEKNVDPNSLQTEFLEEAIEQIYTQALRAQKLRPVDRPQIAIKKFVPYETLEFEATVPVVGEIKLPDYKLIKLAKKPVKVTYKDIEDVIKSLQTRMAEKKDVDKAAKLGNEVWIDFKGVNAKGEPVAGAEGKNYPLLLGSNTFIPGFEDNLIGMKANEEKTFTLTFPKDYGVKALASKKVTFTVSTTKVRELISLKADDEFASKAGPFKTLAELKEDIKKQLTTERQQEADRAYESELIQMISAKSDVKIPQILIDDQLERMEQEERQNLTYRGQTWEEHLKEDGVTAEEHREKKKPDALERIKASLVLAEIAELEQLDVMPEELEIRMAALKSQYKDPQMQEELNKPETRRDIAGRILTEKTLAKLTEYSQA